MRTAFLCVLAVGFAGCGGDGDDDPPKPNPEPRAVTATLDLAKPQSGPPDAGTRAGHGADGALLLTAAPAASFSGKVDPPDATVVATAPDGVPTAVRVEDTGQLVVGVGALPRGTTSLRLEAKKEGMQPWTSDVRITREGRLTARVEVPESDDTAPTTLLTLRGDGKRLASSVSPSSAGGPPHPMVTLERPRLTLSGQVFDPDTGTGRIRVSARWTETCPGSEPREVTKYVPPAQIQRVQLAPGTSAPVRRVRTASHRFGRPGCTVVGEAWAEGTDAHGLQAVAQHLRFCWPRGGQGGDGAACPDR